MSGEDVPFKATHLGALCHICPLKNEKLVPTRFPDHQVDAAVVGIAPGMQEALKGEPFIGPSGQLLDTSLRVAGATRDDVIITNALLCKLPMNRQAETEELACCAPRLRRELQGVKKILLLGMPARDALLPHMTKSSMGDSRGVWLDLPKYDYTLALPDPDGNPIEAPVQEDQKAIVSFHPAFILRGAHNAFSDLLSDVKKFFLAQDDRSADHVNHIVESIDELRDLVDMLLTIEEPLCTDLETSHIKMQESRPGEWWNGYILCMAVGWRPEESWVIPEHIFNTRTALVEVRRLLDHPYGFYGHNIKFDVKYLAHYMRTIGTPIDITRVLEGDTMLMHGVLDERKGTHGLKELASYFYDAPDYEKIIHSYLRKPKIESYAKVPRDVLYKYAGLDIHYTTRLRVTFEKELKRLGLWEYPYLYVMGPASELLSQMEFDGMAVSPGRLEHAADYMGEQTAASRERLLSICGKTDLNVNSPQQLARIIYDDLGLRQKKKSRKTSDRSTNKEVLMQMKGEHPFIDELSIYRRWAKLYSTYATKIGDFADRMGRVHFDFSILGAETGRVSAGIFITIPRKNTPEGKMIRDVFQAGEGRILLGFDHSQAELRWGGWYSGEEFLYEVYENDRDLHSEVAFSMYGPKFSKEQRNYCKMFNFSYLYGGTEHSFAEDTGLPIDQARLWVRKYDANMPKLSAWKKAIFELVKRRGYLITPVGRRRRFTLITQENVHSIKNESVNFPVQSISSDCTMLGLHRAAKKMKELGYDIFPVLFMHDGVYFDAPDDPAIYIPASKIIREIMTETAYEIQDNAKVRYPNEFGNTRRMVFKVDAEVGYSWGELHDLDDATEIYEQFKIGTFVPKRIRIEGADDDAVKKAVKAAESHALAMKFAGVPTQMMSHWACDLEPPCSAAVLALPEIAESPYKSAIGIGMLY